MREELEIKLVGAPRDIAALRRSKVLAKLGGGKGVSERLVSTYFDTDAGTLREAGLSLRLREEPGRRIQTVKQETLNGSLARTEDERVLGARETFPVVAGDMPGGDLIRGANGLKPVVRTVSDRWAVEITKGRTRIEFAFDLGRLEACGEAGAPLRMSPLAEAELELLEGDPEVLFEIARRFVAEAKGRLRLGLTAKAEQARRLAEDPKVIGSKPSLHLGEEDDVGGAFAAALMAGAARLIDVAPAVTELRLPEGVHQTRVALRRLRAVERTFRKVIDDQRTRDLSQRAKEFQRALGPARDWDVFIETVLPPLQGRGYADEGFQALEARAHQFRAESWRCAARTVASPAFNAFLLDLLESAYRQPWRSEGAPERAADFAPRALDKRLAAAFEKAPAPEALELAARHPLRIAVKKLRYLAQTFRSLYPTDERRAYMAAMSKLQDGLGAVNDAVVAQRLANAAAAGQGKAAARAAGFVCGYCASGAQAAASATGADWGAFKDMAPFWRKP